QLIGEARLAGATRAGDADDRRPMPRACECPAHLLHLRTRAPLVVGAFEHTDGAGDQAVIARVERSKLVGRFAHRRHAHDHIIDHPKQTEPAPILGRVDLLHTIALQRLDLVRRDRATAAHHDTYVGVAALAQHVDHVGEVFVVPALVGAHRDRVGVLVDRRAHDVGNATVVAEMDHFRAARLQQAADHVDGRIVAVEQRSGGHEAQWRAGLGRRAAGRHAVSAETGVHGRWYLFLYPRVRMLYS